MTETAPPSSEVSDFQFKLQCRLKVFSDPPPDEFRRICSLVASASRYGLVFVGLNSNCFQVILLKDIEDLEKEVSNYPRRIIDLPSKPTHLSVNSDSTKLSVVIERDGCPVAIFFDVLSFFKEQVTVIKEVRLSASPNVSVLSTDWNPEIPEIFTACKSDGSLGLYEFKGAALEINELPAAAGATCFCWSPKGKQVAVGSKDGKITQYKPDLKAARVVNGPPMNGAPSIISLKWVSNFQFLGVYKTQEPDSIANLIVINAPKTGNPTYVNYEDVCYSYGDARPCQFYMILEHQWNVLMVASSNSMEVGVAGLEGDKWKQWILGDSSRAELPLSQSKQDTMPIGICLNRSSTKAAQCPLLLLLSDHGILCCFYAAYTKPGVPPTCMQLEQVADCSGLKKFTSQVAYAAPSALQPPQPVQPSLPINKQIFTPIPTTAQAPLVKPVQAVPVVPKTTAAMSNFALPTLTPSSTPLFSSNLFGSQPQPQNVVKTPVEAPKVETPVTILPKTEDLKPLETVQSKKIDDSAVQKETEAMIGKLIAEECGTIESEFQAIMHRGRELKVNIGVENEATAMAQQTHNLEEFLKVLKETSSGQASEIHALKQNVIQVWGWYEEARSRFNCSKDPVLLALLQAKPLDPASQRQLDEINHLMYYLDSQLCQGNRALDEQWEKFQDSLSKSFKIQIPTMEAIYQSMSKQLATLQKQKYVLKDISNRIKTHKTTNNSKILISLDNAQDLEEELAKLQLCPDAISQVDYNRTLERQNKLTKQKSKLLYNFFSKRNVTNISVCRPELSDSTVNFTSSLLAPTMSPIPVEKKMHPVKLDFNAPKAESVAKAFGITSTPIVKPKEAANPPKTLFNPNSPFMPFAVTTSTAVAAKPLSNLLTITKPSANATSSTTTFSFSMPASTQFSGNKAVTIQAVPKLTTPSSTSAFSLSNKSGSILGVPVSVPATKTSQAAMPVAKSDSSPAGFSFGNSSGSIFASLENVTATQSSPAIFKGAVTTTGSTAASASKPTFSFSTSAILGIPQPTVSSSAPLFVTPTTVAKTTGVSVKVTPAVPAVTSVSMFGNSLTITPVSLPASTSSAPVVTEAKTTAAPSVFSVQTTAGKPQAPTSSISAGFSFAATSTTVAAKITTTTPFVAPVTTLFAATTSTSTITTTQSSTFVAATAAPSVFGGTSFTSKTTTSAPFGVATTSTTQSVFGGGSQTSASVFGGQATSFGTTPFAATAATSPFGGSAFDTAVSSSGGSLFGQPSSFSGGSIFGGTPTTTAGSVFGGTNVFASTAQTFGSASPFGGAAGAPFGATTTASSPFGATTTASSPFGATTTASSPFGATTTASSPFGATTTASSPFGATTTASSPFCANTTASSPFGATTTASSPFGATTTTPSVFGGVTTATSPFGGGTASSPFGTTTSSSSPFASVAANVSPFGAATTAASPFGGSAAFGNNATPFGAAAATPSPFGQAAATPSPFGQEQSVAFGNKPAAGFGTFGGTTSSFGLNTLNVGSPTTTSSAFGFGQTTQQANPFSRPAGQEQKPTGFSGGSLFGNAATTTASVFGSSAQFSKPAFGSAPVFGGTPAFGTPTSSFGASTFGSNTFGGNAGAFSGGNQSVQGTGFGSAAFQKPASSFGTAPVFGSNAPGFGAAPSFGGSPTFGGTAFGSPQKVFGAPTTESSFGATPQNPTFGNLATQNTLGFGNLAQQAGSATQPTGFSGGSSFSSWR